MKNTNRRKYYIKKCGLIQNCGRYPDDIYDRHWFAYFDEKSWTQVTTNLTVNITNNYELPQVVAATGATPLNDAETLNITWDVEPPTAKFYTYMHFAELQTLRANDTREFNTTMNGKYSYGPYTPTALKIETVLDVKPEQCDEGACLLQLLRTSKSTLPPLLNAMEAFTEINFPQMETNGDDGMQISVLDLIYLQMFLSFCVLISDIIKLYNRSLWYQECSR